MFSTFNIPHDDGQMKIDAHGKKAFKRLYRRPFSRADSIEFNGSSK